MNQQEQGTKEVLALLARAGGALTTEDDIKYQGKAFLLPETYLGDPQGAVDFLQDRVDAEEEPNAYNRIFDYRPWDGANATQNALRKAFGAVVGVTTRSMFGSNPPALVDIKVSPTESIQVPWGTLAIPGLKGCKIELDSVGHPEKGQLFSINAIGPRKFRHHIMGLFNLIQNELETNSIYRGKAFDGQSNPDFLDLSGVDPAKVVYSDETMRQLEANVWAALKWPQEHEDLMISLKRAILLEGPYGTGKTLAAYLTAQIAVANGWTFIMVRPGQDNIHEAMQTARLYEPAVVFFEDIDTISQPGVPGRDGMSKLLDTFDGMSAKGAKLMVILTTNNKEKIHKGMVRPGRLDALIHIGDLDEHGIKRFVENTLPARLIPDNLDYTAIHAAMEGYLPAFVKESIDRAVRYSLAENHGQAITLTTQNFVDSANDLRPQYDLMNGAGEVKEPDALAVALGEVVMDRVNDVIDSTTVHLNNDEGHLSS